MTSTTWYLSGSDHDLTVPSWKTPDEYNLPTFPNDSCRVAKSRVKMSVRVKNQPSLDSPNVKEDQDPSVSPRH